MSDGALTLFDTGRLRTIAEELAFSLLPQTGDTVITPEDVFKENGITDDNVHNVLGNEVFREAFQSARKRHEELGDKAYAVEQSRIIAKDLAEGLWVRMKNNPALYEAKDIIKFYELNMKYGLLDPSTNGQAKQNPMVAIQNNVSAAPIVVPSGIPGMEHITGVSND